MAESDFQRKPLTYAVEALDTYFQSRENVYVSGNLFIYYEEGNPQAVVAPDVFVVIGADKHDRSSYQLWLEPKSPDFVLEITSRSTRHEDQGAKRERYSRMGVREYWQYDPTGDYLSPPLQGFWLVAGVYQPLAATTSPDGTRSLSSQVLGLDVLLEHGMLRFYDPLTGQKFLTYQEAEQARQQAEQARQHAEQAHQQAEQARRHAEQARQQAEQARQHAEQARQHAEQARQQAETHVAREVTARQVAEARIAELEARLRALQAASPPSSDIPPQP